MGTPTLFLAAGHGGPDRGNTAAGVVEADECRAIIADVRRWYKAHGIAATTGGAVFLPDELELNGQLRALAPWKPTAADGDLALDWHLDYAASRPSGGAMVITNRQPKARRFAELFLTRWCAATGIQSNGLHYGDEAAPKWRGWPDFGWTKQPWPACIVELGSLNNARDIQIVRDPFYRALAAQFAWDAWRQA